MPINWLADNNAVFMHAVEYYSAIKKKWSAHTCCNMGEPGERDVSWKKPVTRAWVLYDSIYIEEEVQSNP